MACYGSTNPLSTPQTLKLNHGSSNPLSILPQAPSQLEKLMPASSATATFTEEGPADAPEDKKPKV